MPLAAASRGERRITVCPSMEIVPASFITNPPRTFINVDFPAPFAPISAMASPQYASSEASWSATTPGYRLETPSRRR